jgi:large subunit ribosomal protein L3
MEGDEMSHKHKIYKEGLIGKKVGMSQIFDAEGGSRTPITLLECGPCVVLQKRTQEKDGYTGIVVGFEDKKVNRCNKAEVGYFNKNELKPKKFIKEIRLNAEDAEKYKVGDVVDQKIFQMFQYIDITGTSKGKGFTGVIKRYNFSMAPKKAHEHRRRGGSIGTCMTPGRVFPGRKMPGRHGGVKSTVMNAQIVFCDPENNVIGVRGPVPGPNNGYVVIKAAQKKIAPTGFNPSGDATPEADKKKK